MEKEKNTSSEFTDEDSIHSIMRNWITRERIGEIILEDGPWMAAYSKKEKRIYLYKIIICSEEQNAWIESEHRTVRARRVAEHKIFDTIVSWASNPKFEDDDNPRIINCLVTINPINDDRPTKAMMAVRVDWQYDKELPASKNIIEVKDE